MYKVTAYFKDKRISQIFDNAYDAIDFRDTMDANYPTKVLFEQGVYPMRQFIYETWNSVMNMNVNPLRHIPDLQVRHVTLQILAWMWCIVFSSWVGSIVVFGVSALIHAILLAGIFITVVVFETARRKPQYFGGLGRGRGGEHD